LQRVAASGNAEARRLVRGDLGRLVLLELIAGADRERALCAVRAAGAVHAERVEVQIGRAAVFLAERAQGFVCVDRRFEVRRRVASAGIDGANAGIARSVVTGDRPIIGRVRVGFAGVRLAERVGAIAGRVGVGRVAVRFVQIAHV
jgi:hypothetical protein